MAIQNPSSDNKLNIIHYISLVLSIGLIIIGLYQLFTNIIEGGIINIIVGVSLIFIFISFDSNRPKTWQKSWNIIYGFWYYYCELHMLLKIGLG